MKFENKELLDALAIAILMSDYGDKCHHGFFTPNKHVRTPAKFVDWARARMGENYDPTCLRPISEVVRRDELNLG